MSTRPTPAPETQPRSATPANTDSGPPPDACAQTPADEATCPACGAGMRRWANYYRCRTCGFKESCCF